MERRSVRIAHPTLRGVLTLVEDPARSYQLPLLCHTCHRIHLVKTYHLELDGEGAIVVSDEIAQRVIILTGGQFAITNHVKNPPTQQVGIMAPPTKTANANVAEAIKRLAPAGVRPRLASHHDR